MADYAFAVYIGRFQPIHRAHLESIAVALDKAAHLLLFVGSSNRLNTVKNPWAFDQRAKLITDAVREYFGEPLNPAWEDRPPPSVMDRIRILPLRDYMYNDYKWASEVHARAVAGGAEEEQRTLLVGCEKDDSSYYLKMFPQWQLERIPYLYNLDATDIRTRMFENGGIDEDTVQPSTQRFINTWVQGTDSMPLREEYFYYRDYHKKWEDAPFTPVFITVDAVVIKSGCVLLVKRGFQPGKGRWALPGGFLNPKEPIREAALRELKEETRIKVPKHVLDAQIREVRVFDHPKRSLRGRTITHVHLIDLGYGPLPSVKADTDASGAHWVPLADAMQMESAFFEDHYDIIVNMVSKY